MPRNGGIVPTVLGVVNKIAIGIRRHGIIRVRIALAVVNKIACGMRRHGLTNCVWIALDVQKLNVAWVSRHGVIVYYTDVQNVLQDVMKTQRRKMVAAKLDAKGVQWARTQVRLVQPLALHVNYVTPVNIKTQRVKRLVQHVHLDDMEIPKVSSNVNFVPLAKL
jgi:hypothetical protein